MVVVVARHGHEGGVVEEKVALLNAKFEVEDVEELALDAADITSTEDTSTERPVDVLQTRVVQILQRQSVACQRTYGVDVPC